MPPVDAPAVKFLPFDAFTLAAVAGELRVSMLPAKVQKVQQPSDSEIILSLYGKTGAAKLLLSADPKLFRIHLTQQRRENPITPPAFCQVCRKYLDGAIFLGVTMPRLDRVQHLEFRAHDGERVMLIAELMGRNSNVVLLSGAGIVRGALRHAPPGSERPLHPGSVYVDPPGLVDRIDTLTLTSASDPALADAPSDTAEVRGYLMKTFSGIGRFAADEVVARAVQANILPSEALVGLMDDVRESRFIPYSIVDGEGNTIGVWPFEPLSVPKECRFPRESISIALDTFYSIFSERASEASERTQLQRALVREIAFREKELASARRTLAESARADEYERTGNNLLANLRLITRGDTTVRVPDLYAETADALIDVTLDPKRSPQENAESYFERARKARDAAEYADGYAADLEDDLVRLRGLRIRAEVASADEQIGALRSELSGIIGSARAAKATQTTAERVAARPKEKPFGGYKIRKFDVDGCELLVGETAEANDYLTTRMASPSDLWMHVRSAPGAHGVLRTGGKPDRVPESVIRRAAEIVASRSGTHVKHAGLIAVDIVEKRHVRKPRGSKPGAVSYVFERVLDVSLKS